MKINIHKQWENTISEAMEIEQACIVKEEASTTIRDYVFNAVRRSVQADFEEVGKKLPVHVLR